MSAVFVSIVYTLLGVGFAAYDYEKAMTPRLCHGCFYAKYPTSLTCERDSCPHRNDVRNRLRRGWAWVSSLFDSLTRKL